MTDNEAARFGVEARRVRPFAGERESFEVWREGALIGHIGKSSRRTAPKDWLREMSRGRHAAQVTREIDAYSVYLAGETPQRRGRIVCLDESSMRTALLALLRRA